MSAIESRSSSGILRIGALILALATAGVHLYLFFIEGFLGSATMLPIYQLLFVGNFLTYTTLAIVLNLPVPSLARYRPVVRALLIAVAVASIISYFYVGVTDTTGDVTKIIEVLLISLLTVDAGVARGMASAAAQLVIGAAAGIVMFLTLLVLGLLP
ncbi:MAG: hypothetical protein M3Q49_02980 [Actinomycetota bacterium]|jgi:hypothetical protein|nr:hypothetical protein [Actinomycetota bacterium]MDP9484751.1 hypothetical protein [Actinomycetota bacterium]PLS85286.1 MAG: hypothetical protein CYG60_13420 [Actinomycetota bacterium]